MPRLHVPRESRDGNRSSYHSDADYRSPRHSGHHSPQRSAHHGQQNGHQNGHQNSHQKRQVIEKASPKEPRHASHISPMTAHFVAATGEFIGTFMFLYFSFSCQIMLGTQASDSPVQNGGSSAQTNIFTALVYGFSLLVNVWAFYRISGGLFNPAVTFGMVLAGTLPAVRSLFLVPAQILAGMAAAGLVSCMFPGDISTTNTTLSPGTSIAQGVFIEMFMTAELVFVVLMLAAEKSKDTFLAPLGIGLALFVAMMGGVYYTGGSLNPTRSFGPAVASRQFDGYHWIYWIGPCLGGAIAAGYYRFVKYFNYEEANPGQDAASDDSDGRV